MKFRWLIVFISIVLFLGCSRDNSSSNESVWISATSKKTLTVLAWPGYEEEDFVAEIKQRVPNTEFRFITYVGGEDMLRKYYQNKDRIDLVIVDQEYGAILYKKGELATLASSYPTKELGYFERFVTGSDRPCYDSVKQSWYCSTVRWGTVGLVFHKIYRNDVEANGYRAMNSVKNITIFDWYLPNMGQFSKWMLSESPDMQGQSPFEINDRQLDELFDKYLKVIRPNIKEFQGNLGLVTKAVFAEPTIMPGIGEWAIGAQNLSQCKKQEEFDVDWTIPKQGGLLWIEAVAIPKRDNYPDGKKAFLEKVVSAYMDPTVQAKLAWRKAYISHAPIKAAYDHMNWCEKFVLKYKDKDEKTPDGEAIQRILDPSNTVFRQVPPNYDAWIKKWNLFKSL